MKKIKAKIDHCEFCGAKENCNNYLIGLKEGKEKALKEFIGLLNKSKITIRERIKSEYRKHPTLDWALIATQKIIIHLNESL